MASLVKRLLAAPRSPRSINQFRPEERRIRRKIRTALRLEEQLEVAVAQVMVKKVHRPERNRVRIRQSSLEEECRVQLEELIRRASRFSQEDPEIRVPQEVVGKIRRPQSYTAFTTADQSKGEVSLGSPILLSGQDALEVSVTDEPVSEVERLKLWHVDAPSTDAVGQTLGILPRLRRKSTIGHPGC